MSERERLLDAQDQKVPPWRKWGAYVSERQWGTVREDYSADGNAWVYLPHDLARSKAYRWGEDGIAGFCDRYQYLVLSFAFWNEKDPILKERLFGLNPFEGNHGEDVKEVYFYLDATPTHSYLKFLYKYPQAAFPYDQLVKENKRRSTQDREYELVDTGVFADNRYFDITIEYAKAAPDDIVVKVEVFNRGPQEAPIHLLPQLYFRNRWLWDPQKKTPIPNIHEGPEYSLYADGSQMPPPDWLTADYKLPPCYLYGEKPDAFLFTHNDTHNERVWKSPSRTPYVKDAFHRAIIQGDKKAVNPGKEGTKACFHYASIKIPAKSSRVWFFRLCPNPEKNPLKNAAEIVALRKKEADDFYATLQPSQASPEEKLIQRQALAGMIWSTQFYFYDVSKWLQGDDPAQPPPPGRGEIRNGHWKHLHGHDLIAMPDKWEYPWFASWDMGFHTAILSLIDLNFAKKQLRLFLENQYQHPNGQVPAYEWNFSDTNPPVQAWALWYLYEKDPDKDREYFEFCFLKLMENFDWWVNRVDRMGNNIFEGGFLGLDNISIIDRSQPLPHGEFFEQSDATGWMGFFSLLMMRMALELAKTHPLYETIAILFLEHFIAIAAAMQGTKNRAIDLWDETDGFFYDVLAYPNGSHQQLKVRSCVGLIPFFCLEAFEEAELQARPAFYERFQLFLKHFPELMGRCITTLPSKQILFSLMNLKQMKRVLERVGDPNEFFSPYGLRSLSKYHQDHPFAFNSKAVYYEPGESKEKIKGGNSNWRGPIWFPINYLFVRSLGRLQGAVGDGFQILVDGQLMTIGQMQQTLSGRLISLFKKDAKGLRPIHADNLLLADSDFILFYEHYHGDNGRGLGASHQTGWSGLVANLIAEFF